MRYAVYGGVALGPKALYTDKNATAHVSTWWQRRERGSDNRMESSVSGEIDSDANEQRASADSSVKRGRKSYTIDTKMRVLDMVQMKSHP